jgi:hypothetical protein
MPGPSRERVSQFRQKATQCRSSYQRRHPAARALVLSSTLSGIGALSMDTARAPINAGTPLAGRRPYMRRLRALFGAH